MGNKISEIISVMLQNQTFEFFKFLLKIFVISCTLVTKWQLRLLSIIIWLNYLDSEWIWAFWICPMNDLLTDLPFLYFCKFRYKRPNHWTLNSLNQIVLHWIFKKWSDMSKYQCASPHKLQIKKCSLWLDTLYFPTSVALWTLSAILLISRQMQWFR